MKKLYSLLILLGAVLFYSCLSCDDEFIGVEGDMIFSDLVIQDDKLFVVGSEELITLDFAQPELPFESSRVTLEDFVPESIVADQSCLYINGNRGVVPYDIQSGEIGRTLEDIGGCSSIAVTIDGERLAGCTIIDGRAALATFQLGPDKNLTLQDQLPFSSDIQDIVLDSDWLFVLNRFSGIDIYDLSGAEAELIHNVEEPRGTKLVVNQNRLLISGGDNVYQYRYDQADNRIDFISSFQIN